MDFRLGYAAAGIGCSWLKYVSLLVAIGVNQDGFRDILGICEGAKEDKAGWSSFLRHLKERGLRGVELIISDACMGLVESVADFYPEAAGQRCVVGLLKKSANADSVFRSAGGAFARLAPASRLLRQPISATRNGLSAAHTTTRAGGVNCQEMLLHGKRCWNASYGQSIGEVSGETSFRARYWDEGAGEAMTWRRRTWGLQGDVRLKVSGNASRKDELRLVDSDTLGTDVVVPDRTNLAIEIKNASLHYPVGAYARGSLKSTLLGLLGLRGHRDSSPTPTYVDALRDVDLRINFGERVGLIGHNGSGKSTLLRALAGIYPLAKGDVTVVGRIGTLLDISLGFESEATGRENIYYRGMTMGYSHTRMRKAEAEIVRFADLGEFIDLPMRMYSAGMYVRLGFAISTHFQPDILLVDEVFGAGDVAFAKQALDRMMRMVAGAGIFVIATHDLGLVERVCQRAIWMHGGKVHRDGPAITVVDEYQKHMLGSGR